MNFNLDKFTKSEIESMKTFMSSIENGDSDSMILAAANISAWSNALLRGLDKRLGNDKKHVSPIMKNNNR